MWRHKAAQSLRVFVVYGANFVGAKVADLFHYRRVIFLVVLVVRHVIVVNFCVIPAKAGIQEWIPDRPGGVRDDMNVFIRMVYLLR